MASKSERMYGDSPRMERSESGKMEVKKPDAKEAEASMGDGEPMHAQVAERMSMAHRHSAEHMGMRMRHEMEHQGNKGDKKPMHRMHEAEMGDMHKRHETEMRDMHKRHEMGAPKGDGMAEPKGEEGKEKPKDDKAGEKGDDTPAKRVAASEGTAE